MSFSSPSKFGHTHTHSLETLLFIQKLLDYIPWQQYRGWCFVHSRRLQSDCVLSISTSLLSIQCFPKLLMWLWLIQERISLRISGVSICGRLAPCFSVVGKAKFLLKGISEWSCSPPSILEAERVEHKSASWLPLLPLSYSTFSPCRMLPSTVRERLFPKAPSHR